MKSKKGFALPMVITVMFLVLIISALMLTIVLNTNGISRYTKILFDRHTEATKIKQDFIKNGQVDGEYTLNYNIFKNSAYVDEYIGNTQDIKAIVIKNSNDTEIISVMVYNFDEDELISNQNSNFYITTKQIDNINYYFFADIVKYKEV